MSKDRKGSPVGQQAVGEWADASHARIEMVVPPEPTDVSEEELRQWQNDNLIPQSAPRRLITALRQARCKLDAALNDRAECAEFWEDAVDHTDDRIRRLEAERDELQCSLKNVARQIATIRQRCYEHDVDLGEGDDTALDMVETALSERDALQTELSDVRKAAQEFSDARQRQVEELRAEVGRLRRVVKETPTMRMIEQRDTALARIKELEELADHNQPKVTGGNNDDR